MVRDQIVSAVKMSVRRQLKAVSPGTLRIISELMDRPIYNLNVNREILTEQISAMRHDEFYGSQLDPAIRRAGEASAGIAAIAAQLKTIKTAIAYNQYQRHMQSLLGLISQLGQRSGQVRSIINLPIGTRYEHALSYVAGSIMGSVKNDLVRIYDMLKKAQS